MAAALTDYRSLRDAHDVRWGEPPLSYVVQAWTTLYLRDDDDFWGTGLRQMAARLPDVPEAELEDHLDQADLGRLVRDAMKGETPHPAARAAAHARRLRCGGRAPGGAGRAPLTYGAAAGLQPRQAGHGRRGRHLLRGRARRGQGRRGDRVRQRGRATRGPVAAGQAGAGGHAAGAGRVPVPVGASPGATGRAGTRRARRPSSTGCAGRTSTGTTSCSTSRPSRSP
ncbi:hypothetical protein [Nonomuraea salmonea]|uniref:hypothetical protein n=1 Tax=Nonomuraea salmonea TaxID=46181 RepID=UPI0031EEF599